MNQPEKSPTLTGIDKIRTLEELKKLGLSDNKILTFKDHCPLCEGQHGNNYLCQM